MKRKESTYRKFLAYYRPHRKELAVDLLFALIFAVCNLLYPTIARYILNDFVFRETFDLALISSVLVLGIFIVKAVFKYLIQYHGHVLGVKIQEEMRSELFAHLQKLPVSYFDNNSTGGIISKIVNGLFEVSELAHHLPEEGSIALISFIGATILIFTIHPILALIIALVIPIFIIFTGRLRHKMIHAFKKTREKTGEISAEIENSISGIRITRSYTAEDSQKRKFEISNHGYRKARQSALKIMGKYHSVTNFIIDILYLACTIVGAYLCFKGVITEGDLTALVLYISMLIVPIETLVYLTEQIEDGITGFVRFQEVLKVEPEIESESAISVDKLSGNICFKNVYFSYENEDNESKVLKNINLDVKKGSVTAIVGASGAGKSTICMLLPRFYRVDKGEITIDGINVNDINSQDLRRNIGIVAQDTFLFSGTIKENIAYGKEGATMDEIIKASKLAGVHEFAIKQQDGYETFIGEHGVKLSGGQRQRISIARAFLKNPPILILDEATSSLDNVTEKNIQQALEELEKGRTTIIIAHRLSTIVNANEIIVMKDGEIVERGTHKELILQNGEYSKLYASQI